MIYQLNYISKENTPFKQADIDELGAYAKSANHKNNITGFLMYREGYFVQILEGSLEDVESLFEKIESDKRHTIVREKIIKKVVERSFADWALEVKVATSNRDIKYIRSYDPHAFYLLSRFDISKLI